jgi:mRNA-degrading endonuclease YafQ of YafQ-DinJ toxin-antitoxin module
MKTKIFQVCFESFQFDQVDVKLTPFDNTENKHPELREYYNFLKVIDDGLTDDLNAWGVFGPRWYEKLKVSSDKLFKEIENNPEKDVYLFNHARVQDALFFNVWEQGEYYHKGLKDIAKHVLEKLNYDSGVVDNIMESHTTCYCSYFVGTTKFWKDYLDFLAKVTKELDNLPEELYTKFSQSANYKRDKDLNLFPFLVERLFSTFLLLNKYKTHALSYDYSVYSNQMGEFTNVLQALSNLKTLTLKYNSHEIFAQWNDIRSFILKSQPQILNLD